jgi:hypothetical protein
MSTWSRSCLLVSFLALLFRSPLKLMAAEEAARTFPVQKCRFTLPGPDWTWIDKEVPNVLFMAGNTKGFVINLATVRTPDPVQINEPFAKEFEESLYQPGQIEKRGGRFVTFRGLPSYQAEGILADGRTSATRVFTANGFVYHLTLLGAKEPIEKDPAFETLMQGFEFTAPLEPDSKRTGSEVVQAPAGSAGQTPPATDSDYGKALNVSAWMGRIAGVCILGAILLLAFRWAFRKPKITKT